MAKQRPNILLIMADQMSALSMRLYTGQGAKTPGLEAMAASGVVFENAYCNYPLCAPARFGMMAGQLPSRIKAYDNAAELPAATPTIAHYLRSAGYYTCLSGKMHFVGPDQFHGFEDRLTTEIYPADFSWTPSATYDDAVDPATLDQPEPGVSGIETVIDAGAYARSLQLDYDEEVAHRAVQKIYDRARGDDDRPFFMTVSFTHPHDPYVITREYWERHADAEIDAPRVPPIPLDELDPQSHGLHSHYGLHRVEMTDEIVRRARRGYYGMISYIDDKVTALRAALADAGLADNTAIIMTSDHGDMMGERGMWFKKTLFEQAIRVPMILHWPVELEPARVSAPASLVDVLPTIVDIAGVDTDSILKPSDGASLLASARGVESEERAVMVEHIDGATDAPRVMVRRGAWKLVYSEAYPPQLYNLDDDPEQLRDLVGIPEHATIQAELREIVAQTWDLPALRQDVIDDQRKRRFVADALMQGRIESWDHPPGNAPSRSLVRQGDLFPEVEQRRYLRYPQSS
jgi:choline-sulfatase